MKKPIAGTLLSALGVIWFSSISAVSCSPSAGKLMGSGGKSGKGGVIGAGGAEGGGTGGTTVEKTFDLGLGGAPPASTGTGGSTAPPPDAQDCGSTTSETKPILADILIVLDRSDSMKWDLTSDTDCSTAITNCTARMPAVVSGLGTVLDANPGIHWGLEVFPSPNTTTCANVSTTPQVPIGADKGSAIKSQLATMNTSLGTQTRSAIEAAVTYLKTVNDGNNKVILLATDGYPNCLDYTTTPTRPGIPGGTTINIGGVGSDDMPGTATAIAAALSAGFPTYVVGIGPGVDNLNTLAEAGGTKNYYPATSAAELAAALGSIVKVVSTTCTFKAGTVPPDSGLVYVYVDKKFVAKDDSNGWAFDSSDSTNSTVVLTGSYCQDMLSGATTKVQITFGCPYVAPPQYIP